MQSILFLDNFFANKHKLQNSDRVICRTANLTVLFIYFLIKAANLNLKINWIVLPAIYLMLMLHVLQVFECVITWVQHDLDTRHKHLAALMEHVRLPLMSQEYLMQHVEEEPLLKADLQCKDYIIEALKYHLLKGDSKTTFRTPRTKPRQPVGLPKVLLVVGGQAPKAIRSVECFDFKEEKWYQVAEMPTRRCRAGLAVLHGKVYAVGGFNGSLRVRTVDVYDAALDQWSTCDHMEARRSTLGVAVLGNCIYAVGGFDGSTGLNTAEMFDPTTQKWRSIAPMSTRRSSVGVGVLYGLLYAVSGVFLRLSCRIFSSR
jgi:kelch-like protein 2/3